MSMARARAASISTRTTASRSPTPRAHPPTPIRHARGGDGLEQLLIGPTQGRFQGQLEERSYELRIHTTDRPSSISVDGRPLSPWTWDADQTTAVATLPRRSIRERMSVAWR